MKHPFMKRGLALLLALTLGLGLGLHGFAAEQRSEAHADALHALRLFQGTGTKADGTPDYALDSAPTRLHGLVMLIRLLGLEDAAKATTEPNPFRDVNAGHDSYGVPYLAYAYAKGLTQGRSADAFDPDTALAARDYVTFLLRALGYDDKAGDFSWAKALPFAASIGMMSDQAAKALADRKLDRGDMVDLSYAALCRSMKGGAETLAEHLRDEGLFTQAEGEAAGVLNGEAWAYELPADSGLDRAPAPVAEPVQYESRTVNTSRGLLTANVITVNMSDSRVRVRSAMVDGTLGHTAWFSDIVSASGCVAAVNGNFFEAYKDFQRPIGHVMVDGSFLYCNSGLSSLGITRDGRALIGRLPVFTRVSASNGDSWAAYEINTVDGQSEYSSVLYLPSFGQNVAITAAGNVILAENGVITGYRAVAAGDSVAIPVGGFVFFVGPGFMADSWNHEPQLGAAVTGIEPYLINPTEDSFSLDGVVSIVSGGPRLVKDGAIETEMESAFNDPKRFGDNVAVARTAVGVRKDGTLVLVSTASGATIQQMRELMLALDCEDAFNLDGGASCAMYCQGRTIVKPGRQLTTTLQVFVEP